MITANEFAFHLLALISVICAVGVVLSRNPIYSAFYLVMTMVAMAGIFV